MFAKATLDAIFKFQKEFNYNLVGVVTIKDKIAGRGQKKQESLIKKTARKLNLKIYTESPNHLYCFALTIWSVVRSSSCSWRSRAFR